MQSERCQQALQAGDGPLRQGFSFGRLHVNAALAGSHTWLRYRMRRTPARFADGTLSSVWERRPVSSGDTHGYSKSWPQPFHALSDHCFHAGDVLAWKNGAHRPHASPLPSDRSTLACLLQEGTGCADQHLSGHGAHSAPQDCVVLRQASSLSS